MPHNKSPLTWSVMIPAYRCSRYLPQCIESILTQTRGRSGIQVALVNDDPGDGTAAKVAASFAADQVEYHQNERNLGAGGNFNRCLALATGELVLILHGDCYLKPGFIDRISALAEAYPETGAFACRAEGVDEQSHVLWLSRRYPEFESVTRDDSPIWTSLHLMPSAVVIRSSLYRRIGGFREDIANGQDWEMWCRAIRAGGIIMSPEVLAVYRQHGDSITARTCRTAQNIREFDQLYGLFATERANYPLRQMRRGLQGMAWGQACEFRRRGDQEAAAANLAAWRELTPWPARALTHLKTQLKRILAYP